jgi:hypothetical protein
MKQFLSAILAVVLVGAVGGTLVSGTWASFVDTEVSTGNYMCAGTRVLDLSGGPIAIRHGMPSHHYSEEFTLINSGTLDGEVILHIPAEDDPNGEWQGIISEEAGSLNGVVYNGVEYVVGSAVGGGTASSESELVAEEDGLVGQLPVDGLGVDAGGDDGPSAWLMSKHIDLVVWFDENGDGDFDDPGELILGDPTGVNPVKLADIACEEILLGVIPASSITAERGNGWGSYFEYQNGVEAVKVPLIAGQDWLVGYVWVWIDGDYLHVEFDTTGSAWGMAETHLYVSTSAPTKLAPGKFPYKQENLGGALTDTYTIPLDEINGGIDPGDPIYIAAHATGSDDEETAWGQGISRKFKIELHLQQITDPAWTATYNPIAQTWEPAEGMVDYDQDGDKDDDDAQKRFWPTDIFQGDKCTFDMVFTLRKESP